jgi:hypothetical protein
MRIDEMGVGRAHLPCLGVHLCNKARGRSSALFGRSDAGIVGAGEQNGVEQVARREHLAGPHAECMAGGRGSRRGGWDRLLGWEAAGQHQGGEYLGGAGRWQALIGIPGVEHGPTAGLDDDGGGSADGRRFRQRRRRWMSLRCRQTQPQWQQHTERHHSQDMSRY